MKKLLLILLCIPMIGFGQNVNIPDVNFKAYLVGNTAINTNGDTEIQVSEANAFNGNINCQSMNISDLTGIEYFTALTYLHCGTNNLTSLDVSNNTALVYLLCHENQLSSLDVSNNPSLGSLVCRNNNLTSLDVSNNSTLILLGCSSNQLTSLDVSNNTVLESLYCENNQITSLDLSNAVLLSSINANDNFLTSVSFSGSYNSCFSWEFSNNLLDSVTMPIMNQGDFIDFSNNQLVFLDVSATTYTVSGIFIFKTLGNPMLNCVLICSGCSGNNGNTGTNDPQTYFSSNCTVSSSIVNLVDCDSTFLNGNTYYASDTIVDSIFYNLPPYNFISIDTTLLTIAPTEYFDTSITACDVYYFNQAHYYASTNITGTLTAQNGLGTWAGCDSIVTLNLTINYSYDELSTVTACDTFFWDNYFYTTSGSYTNYYTSIGGCDSIHSIDLIVNSSPNTTNILGNTNVIPLDVETYSVGQNLNSTFTWNLDNGGIIANGINTNSVEVQWGNTIGSFILYVVETEQNGCTDTSFININVLNGTAISENFKSKNILKIIDILGRDVKGDKNQPFFYLYDDGTVEKRIVIE